MKNFVFPVLFLLIISATGCTSIHQPRHSLSLDKTDEIPKLFNQAQSNAVFITYDGYDLKYYGNDLQRAHIPNHSFISPSLLITLIGLQAGTTSTAEVFQREGERQIPPVWNKDLTLSQAIKISALPVFQKIAQRVDPGHLDLAFQHAKLNLEDFDFQYSEFAPLFPIKRSPAQEVRFIYQLAKNKLSFDKTVQQQTAEMLYIERRGDSKLYAQQYKNNVNPDISGYVGWVEQADGKVTAFILDMQNHIDTIEPKPVALSILDKLGLFFYLR